MRQTTLTPQILLKMSVEMQALVVSPRYLGEVVLAVRELGKAIPPELLDMLTYVSFCNSNFTMMVIKYIMVSGLMQSTLAILMSDISIHCLL